MKLKHFLRGLGAGIIFSAIIMLVGYMTSGSYRMSDDEVKKRAKQLGMVEREQILTESSSEEATSEAIEASETSETSEATISGIELVSETTETTTVETTEATTEKTTTEKATTEKTTTEKATTEKATTEKATTEKATTEKATTEKATTEKATTESSKSTIEVEVTSGMDSETVASLLEKAGVVDDASKFDAYLNSNGYATKIKINKFKLSSDMTYKEIAEKLISEGK